MTVSFFGSVLSHTGGKKSIDVEECQNVLDLVSRLTCHFGDAFGEFVLSSENCFFLINGKGLMMTGGLETKLNPGDRIELLPFTQAG